MIFFDCRLNEIRVDCLPAPGEVFAWRGPDVQVGEDVLDCLLPDWCVGWIYPGSLACIVIYALVSDKATAEMIASRFN